MRSLETLVVFKCFQLINQKPEMPFPNLLRGGLTFLCGIWLLITVMKKSTTNCVLRRNDITDTCSPLHLQAETGQNLTGSQSRHVIPLGRTCINKSCLSIQCVCTCHLLFRATCLSQGLFQLLISLTIVSLPSLNL